MLSYAFEILNDKGYNKIETENFENTAELFSEILIIGVGKQIKQGLIKDYIEINETTSSIKGKINITQSIKEQSFIKKQLHCNYDEFTVNCYLNQIIKSTINLLIKLDISPNRKKKLKSILIYFGEVDLINLNEINWRIRFDRNNQNYRMLVGICYLTINGLLQTEKSGKIKLMEFKDNKQMSALYEKFILNYYIKEHPELKVSNPQIKWQLDDGFDFMLPKMQTDITLTYNEKILIIDAKYYSKNTQTNYDKDKIISNNLYQIFAYVKNKEIELTGVDHDVSGMLLYAKTDDDIQPDNEYMMSGNKISVKTLDLNQEFNLIKKQLDNIIIEFIG